jgi:hypothetical protein
MQWLYRLYVGFRWLIALILIAAGCLVGYQAEYLMLVLIHKVGEERALGNESVIRLGGGGTLLTNPVAMIRWTMPFWGLGAVMIGGGVLLMFPWVRDPGDRVRCSFESRQESRTDEPTS